MKTFSLENKNRIAHDQDNRIQSMKLGKKEGYSLLIKIKIVANPPLHLDKWPILYKKTNTN